MIERLDIPTGEATTAAARDLAYYLCSAMRQGRTAGEALSEIYPNADATAPLGVILAANGYCVDAV